MEWFGPRVNFYHSLIHGVPVPNSIRAELACEICRGDISDSYGAMVLDAIRHTVHDFESNKAKARTKAERRCNRDKCVAYMCTLVQREYM